MLRKSLHDTRAAAAVVRAALPVAGGVGLLAALALGIGLSFGLLRRLERLRRGARALADEGSIEPLARRRHRDEVGEVALALETMRARLHAEERGRQAFLATASHELRTPLASLRGTVELLDEELAHGAPDLGVRRRAAAAQRQIDRHDGLAWTCSTSAGSTPSAAGREPVDLAELAGTIAAEIAPRARTAPAHLELDAPEPVWALGDPRAIARILRALLDNALRYGAPPAAGDDRRRRTRRARRLRVSDAGPGVPEAERERIFGRFERGGARRAPASVSASPSRAAWPATWAAT